MNFTKAPRKQAGSLKQTDIINQEIIKQTGGLGNYILKATVAIHSVATAGLFRSALGPARQFFETPDATPFLIAGFIVFSGLNVTVWWIAVTFSALHARIARQMPVTRQGRDPGLRAKLIEPILACLFASRPVPTGA